MKQLKPSRLGQEKWELNGRTFSIVDLCAWPHKDEPKISGWDEATSFYKPFNFEVAELTAQGISVIGRYKSFEEARRAMIRLVLEGEI